MKNINITPTDFYYEDFQKLAPFGCTFIPFHLDLSGEKRK